MADKIRADLNGIKTFLEGIYGQILSNLRDDAGKMGFQIILPNGENYGFLYLTIGWSYLRSGAGPHTIFLEKINHKKLRFIAKAGSLEGQVHQHLQEDAMALGFARRSSVNAYLVQIKRLIQNSTNDQYQDADGCADVSQVHDNGVSLANPNHTKPPYAIGMILVYLRDPTIAFMKVALESPGDPVMIQADDANTAVSELCDEFNSLGKVSHDELDSQYRQCVGTDNV